MLPGSKRKAVKGENRPRPRSRKDYTLELAQIFDGILQNQIKSLQQQNAELEAFMGRINRNNRSNIRRAERRRLKGQLAGGEADEANEADDDGDDAGDSEKEGDEDDAMNNNRSASSDYGEGNSESAVDDSDEEHLMAKKQKQKQDNKEKGAAASASKAQQKGAKIAGKPALPRSAFHLFSSVRRPYHLQVRACVHTCVRTDILAPIARLRKQLSSLPCPDFSRPAALATPCHLFSPNPNPFSPAFISSSLKPSLPALFLSRLAPAASAKPA
jgi:hypothetical protein